MGVRTRASAENNGSKNSQGKKVGWIENKKQSEDINSSCTISVVDYDTSKIT